MEKMCLRCGIDSPIDELGSVLVHFICFGCRGDNHDWHWGTDVTIGSMEAQLPVAVLTEVEDDSDE